jgi:hypothetical protein
MNDSQNQPPYTQLVAGVLENASRPLTVDEILARVEQFRPVDTRDPRATVRAAMQSNRRIASLGGRPARYTWWPRNLADNVFRQPLARSDLESGTLVMNYEVWQALWPDFFAGASRSEGDVTLELADGPVLQARVEHLVKGEPVWGLRPTPALARWYAAQGLSQDDDLVVRVLDVAARRYRVWPSPLADRDDAAIVARNQALADVVEQVLRSGRRGMPHFDLVPRLIAHGAFRDPALVAGSGPSVPPDPWEAVLETDFRFLLGKNSVHLVERVVDDLEEELEVPPDPHGWPRPQGDRRKAETEKARQAWGNYLFDRGMDHKWAGWDWAAEAYYREALRLDPGHADAWVHLGNLRFAEGWVEVALVLYEYAQVAAEARTIGDPATYEPSFWLDVDSRPFMRALHGRGLCLWRLGRTEEAREVFAWMLELNPNDNQGVRFLLADIDAGLSWEEGMAEEE